MSHGARIALVSRQLWHRELLSRYLASDAQYEVAWSDDGQGTLVTAQPADVLIVDLDVSANRMSHVVEEARCWGKLPRVIFLAAGADDVRLAEALRLQGHGYVLKSAPLHDLMTCVHHTVAGGTWVSPALEQRLQAGRRPEGRQLRFDPPHHPLTNREVQILKCLAEGDSVKDAAARLHLSPKSVNNHKYRIMQKLGLNDRVRLARYAIREGLIDA